MEKAIADMTNKGMKNIADLGIEAFVDLLMEQGNVTIGDDEYGKEDLMKIWTDVSKDAFKQAAKGKKTKGKAAGDKPKRAKSGFLLFCEDRRPKLQADGLDFKTVATTLGQEWQALGDKGKATWNNKAKSQVQVQQPIDAPTVQWATKAAETFATENNLANKVKDGTITGTGKEKNGVAAIKLSDLKTWLKDHPGHDEEEEEEEEAEEAEEAEEEEEEEEADEEADEEEEEDPKSWVGWKGQVWSDEEDDWKPGEITKYTVKSGKHTIKYDDGSKNESIDIKALLNKEEFEWIEDE